MQYLASDISLEGFSAVADTTGDITDSDNLLAALAKLQNRTASAPVSAFAQVPAQKGKLVYDGTTQEPVWTAYNESYLRRLSGSEIKATDAGTYTVIFSLVDGASWEDDGTFGDRIVQWKIEKATVKIPSQTTTLTYDGSEQSPTWDGYDAAQLSISGTTSAVDAGSYTVSFTPTKNYAWEDGSSDTKEITWTIRRATITQVPSTKDTFVYDGNEKSPTWQNYDPEQLSSGGTAAAVEAGTYVTQFTPNENYMWADGSTDTKEITWIIEKITPKIVATPSLAFALTYTGAEQAPVWRDLDTDAMTVGGTMAATEAGSYVTTFTLNQYYVWADDNTEPKSITWEVQKASLETPSVTDTFFDYDGKNHSPSIGTFNENLIAVTGNTEKNTVGDYEIVFVLKNPLSCQWSDGTTADKKVSWTIGNFTLNAIPAVTTKLTYSGSSQSPTWINFDSARLEMGGTTSATQAGTYTATFTPKDGFVWADNTSTAKSVSWTINKANLAIPTVTNTTFTYNGKDQSPKIGTYDTKLITVTNTAQKNAGSYTTTFAVKDTANYQWSDGTTANKTVTWKISKVTLAVPTVTGTAVEYDEQPHTPTIGTYDANLITVTGNGEQTEIGKYTITFALKTPTNYQWANGSTANQTVEWEIVFSYNTFYAKVDMLESNSMRFGTDVFVLADI